MSTDDPFKTTGDDDLEVYASGVVYDKGRNSKKLSGLRYARSDHKLLVTSGEGIISAIPIGLPSDWKITSKNGVEILTKSSGYVVWCGVTTHNRSGVV